MSTEATSDIIKALFEAFNPAIAINEITDNEDGTFDITVDELLNTRPKRTITISDVTYTVTEVDVDNKIITVTSEEPIAGTVYYAPYVYFFHGTPLAVAQEMVNIKSAASKIPMVYLYEILEDNRFPDRNNALDRETEVRLFFLDQADYNTWDTDQHYELSIMPMVRYANIFFDVYLRDSKIARQVDDYRLKYFPKFNPQVDFKGVLSSLFSDTMSGCEATVRIQIKKTHCRSAISFITRGATIENSDGDVLGTTGTGGTFVVDDATVVLKDTAGAVISNTDIPSGVSSDVEAPDGAVTIKNSAATIIESGVVKSNGTEEFTIGDSVVSNSDDSFSQNVPAETNYELADTRVRVYLDGILNVDQNIPTLKANQIITIIP